MNYRLLNNLTGWAVFAVALVTYLLTMAPTASFWDCGEFIACSNELEVPHPPGAPFFLLLGRIFAMFAGADVERIAWFLNLFSVLSSAFTVLFTVWITTHLAKKLFTSGEEGSLSFAETIAVLASGAVAGLVTTFADSFWFNAVEAEVYALSSFFTAVVVWLMFKWEARADEPGNERWIILIAYLMGLSIGVHLLNLLTVPALAFIYYFRKNSFSWGGFILTGIISVAILAVIQSGVILHTFDFAWFFEKNMVGTVYPNGSEKSGMGLPVGSGIALFFTLFFGAIAFGVFYTAQKKLKVANTALLSLVVIYIGFSSYLMIPVRSQANPPIDENNPENTSSFISYMKREQYGNRPLFFGPLYNAQPISLKKTGKEYVLEPGSDRYMELGDKLQYEYAASDKKLFPRMYEASKINAGPYGYNNFVKKKGDPNIPSDDKPTAAEDLAFAWSYQFVHMYWRYFMWNFAGREGDVQDLGWESGLRFDQISQMPDFIKDAPAKNHYYLLPFLLGLLGLFVQGNKKPNDAIVTGLLFFFTGIAIIIYLNQYPAQPRERDYSFAGSFQTFAIWVGLGVAGIYSLLHRFLKDTGVYVGVALGLLAPVLMAAENWDDHSRAGNYLAPESAYNLLNSVAKDGILFTNGDNDTFPLWYLQEVEGVRTDVRVLCLSYVNTDWYIDQMYKQYNESSPLPLTLKKNEYQGQENQSRNLGNRATLNLSLPVNKQDLIAGGLISEADTPFVQSPMSWTLRTRGGANNKYLELKDVLILNLLENVAKEGWKRPVYFANTVAPNSFLDLNTYLRLEGLAYRVLPVKKPSEIDPYDPYDGYPDLAKMDSSLTKVFKYTNLDNPKVYYDENAMRMVSNYYNTFYRLANAYLKEADAKRAAGDTVAAEQLKTRSREVMEFSEKKFPYQVAMPDPYMLIRTGLMYERLGMKEKADEYYAIGEKVAFETLEYYESIGQTYIRGREYFISLNLLAQQYQQGRRDDALVALTDRMSRLRGKYQ